MSRLKFNFISDEYLHLKMTDFIIIIYLFGEEKYGWTNPSGLQKTSEIL